MGKLFISTSLKKNIFNLIDFNIIFQYSDLVNIYLCIVSKP